MKSLLASARGAPFVALLAALLAASCSATPKGGLVLAISTNMQTPKDIDVISIFVATGGVAKFDYLGRVLSRGTLELPATLALVQPDDPSAQVHIRVIAFKEQNALVLRDVLTTVPTDRTGLLRLPLDFLDLGSGSGVLPPQYVPDGESGAPEGDTMFDPTTITSRCDWSAQQQTSVEGVCTSAVVAPASIPTYDPVAVLGDASFLPSGQPSSCFDVAQCFASSTPVANLDMTSCAFPLPAGASAATLNVAMQTTSFGDCDADGACLVPLPNDPLEGWVVDGDSVQLTPGICKSLPVIDGFPVLLVVSTGPCAAEVTSLPVCEDGDAGTSSIEDGAAPLADGSLGTSSSGGGDATTPAQEAGPSEAAGNFVGIMGGEYHSCAWTSTGAASCWGIDEYGEYGAGNVPGSQTAVPGATGLSVSAMAGDNDFSCAVTTGGAAWCWGYNSYGSLGNGTTNGSLVPVQVTGLTSGVTAIAAGYDYACAVTAGGGVMCWGDGALGNGSSSESNSPVNVTGLSSGLSSVAAGFDHACAVTTAGAVECWGDGSDGDLGNGLGTESLTPVPVTGLSSGVTAVVAGMEHTCALTSAGVMCWGENNDGQLGDNEMGTNSNVPVAVTGLSSGVTSLASGYNHTCAVTTGGGVVCWGNNDDGQLGNDSTVSSPVPVPVSGLSSGVAALAAGYNYTCALTTLGGVACWGNNGLGQTNVGTQNFGPVPVVVPQ